MFYSKNERKEQGSNIITMKGISPSDTHAQNMDSVCCDVFRSTVF